jgi:hypothetical protein
VPVHHGLFFNDIACSQHCKNTIPPFHILETWGWPLGPFALPYFLFLLAFLLSLIRRRNMLPFSDSTYTREGLGDFGGDMDKPRNGRAVDVTNIVRQICRRCRNDKNNQEERKKKTHPSRQTRRKRKK